MTHVAGLYYELLTWMCKQNPNIFKIIFADLIEPAFQLLLHFPNSLLSVSLGKYVVDMISNQNLNSKKFYDILKYSFYYLRYGNNNEDICKTISLKISNFIIDASPEHVSVFHAFHQNIKIDEIIGRIVIELNENYGETGVKLVNNIRNHRNVYAIKRFFDLLVANGIIICEVDDDGAVDDNATAATSTARKRALSK
jgi:hypothetical protein